MRPAGGVSCPLEIADMRALVLVLAGLAGLKVYTQDQLWRSATADAVVEAYRDRAVEACVKGGHPEARAASAMRQMWTKETRVTLVIGRDDVDVAIWDVENPLWAVRFKSPRLLLTASGASGETLAACEFDVALGKATIRHD